MNLKRICDWLLRKLYPPRCIFCQKILNDGARLHVCSECAASVEKVPFEHCPVCGRVTPLGDSVCWSCSVNKIPFKSHRSVYFYRDKARGAVTRFKFRNKPHYAETMGQLMSVYAPGRSSVDCVTYVPMTKRAVKKRGYNQAFLLAERIAEIIGVECEPVLEKTRETGVQSRLGFKKRQRNIKGAFAASGNVKDKNILLVDDVFTTGATMAEAAKTLKKAGAKEINCLSFALTQRKENE